MGLPTNNVFILRNSVTSTSLAAAVQSAALRGPGAGHCLEHLHDGDQGNTITGAFRDAITSGLLRGGPRGRGRGGQHRVQLRGQRDRGEGRQRERARVGQPLATNDAGDNPVWLQHQHDGQPVRAIYIFRNTGRWTSTGHARLPPSIRAPPSRRFIFHNSQDASAAVRARWTAMSVGPASSEQHLEESRVHHRLRRRGGDDLRLQLSPDHGLELPYAYERLRTTPHGPPSARARGEETTRLNVDPRFADTALHHPGPRVRARMPAWSSRASIRSIRRGRARAPRPTWERTNHELRPRRPHVPALDDNAITAAPP